MAEASGTLLDYSRSSVGRLDRVLRVLHRSRDWSSGHDDEAWRLACRYGAYLGETMLRNDFAGLGFAWGEDSDGEPCIVRTAEAAGAAATVSRLVPIFKCYKCLLLGGRESVACFYASSLSIVSGREYSKVLSALGDPGAEAPGDGQGSAPEVLGENARQASVEAREGVGHSQASHERPDAPRRTEGGNPSPHDEQVGEEPGPLCWYYFDYQRARGRRFTVVVPDQWELAPASDGPTLARYAGQAGVMRGPLEVVYVEDAKGLDAETAEAFRSALVPEARVQMLRRAAYGNVEANSVRRVVGDWLVRGRNCQVLVFEARRASSLTDVPSEASEFLVRPVAYDHEDSLMLACASGTWNGDQLRELALSMAKSLELDDPVEPRPLAELDAYGESPVDPGEFSELVSGLARALNLSASERMNADLWQAIRQADDDASALLVDGRIRRVQAESYNAALCECVSYYGRLVGVLERQAELGAPGIGRMLDVLEAFADAFVVDHVCIEGDEAGAEAVNGLGIIRIPNDFEAMRERFDGLRSRFAEEASRKPLAASGSTGDRKPTCANEAAAMGDQAEMAERQPEEARAVITPRPRGSVEGSRLVDVLSSAYWTPVLSLVGVLMRAFEVKVGEERQSRAEERARDVSEHELSVRRAEIKLREAELARDRLELEHDLAVRKWKELESARLKLAAATQRLREADTESEAARRESAKLEMELAQVRSVLAERKAELSRLGLFAFSKKKAAKDQIAALERSQGDIAERIAAYKRADGERHEIQKEIDGLNETIAGIEALKPHESMLGYPARHAKAVEAALSARREVDKAREMLSDLGSASDDAYEGAVRAARDSMRPRPSLPEQGRRAEDARVLPSGIPAPAEALASALESAAIEEPAFDAEERSAVGESCADAREEKAAVSFVSWAGKGDVQLSLSQDPSTPAEVFLAADARPVVGQARAEAVGEDRPFGSDAPRPDGDDGRKAKASTLAVGASADEGEAESPKPESQPGPPGDSEEAKAPPSQDIDGAGWDDAESCPQEEGEAAASQQRDAQDIGVIEWAKNYNDVSGKVILFLLDGLTRDETARECRLPSKVVDSLVSYGLGRKPPVREDQYARLFEKYSLSLGEFTAIFGEPASTYRYLTLAYQPGLKSLSEMLDDDGLAGGPRENLISLLGLSSPDATDSSPAGPTPSTVETPGGARPSDVVEATGGSAREEPRVEPDGGIPATGDSATGQASPKPKTATEWALSLDGVTRQVVQQVLFGNPLVSVAAHVGISAQSVRELMHSAMSGCPDVREDSYQIQFNLCGDMREFCARTGEPEITYRFLYWRNRGQSGSDGSEEAPKGPDAPRVSEARKSEGAGERPARRGLRGGVARDKRPAAPRGSRASELQDAPVLSPAQKRRLTTCVDRMAVKNREYSVTHFYRALPSLMRECGIVSKGQLFEVLKSVYQDDPSVSFGETDEVRFGACNRKLQLDLLARQRPLMSAEELADEYERRYGFRAGRVVKWIAEYGIVAPAGQAGVPKPKAEPAGQRPDRDRRSDSRAPASRGRSLGRDSEYEEFLRGELASDCCDRRLVAERFAARFPDGPKDPFSDRMLLRLGYTTKGKKLLFRRGVEPGRYFTRLIESHPLFQRGDKGFENAVFNDPTFRGILRQKMHSFEVVEYEKDSFIAASRLCEQMDVSPDAIRNYSQDVVRKLRAAKGVPVPFTVWSLRHTYHIDSPLDVLSAEGGMSDYLYETLFDIDPHVQCCSLAKKRGFLETEGKFVSGNFLECVVEMNGPLEVGDLMDLLKREYGIDIAELPLRHTISSTSLYYDDITEMVFNSRSEWEEMVNRELA